MNTKYDVKFTNIVEAEEGRYYYVDTSFAFDCMRLETMAFPCYDLPKPGTSLDSTVSSWSEELCRRYDTEEEAKKGHKNICNHLGKIVM